MSQYDRRSNPSSDSDHRENMEERAPPMAYNQGAERTKRTRRPSYVPPDNIRPPPPQPQEQPRPTIHQAVSSAFLNTNTQQIGNQELVDTITQQVIQSLRASGFGASPAAPPVHDPTPVPQKDLPPRNVYTPPSPEKYELPKIDPTGPKADARSPTTDSSMEEAVFGRRSTMRPASPPPSARRTEDSRPRPPERQPTDDTTTLEKIWQPLFTADGKPTPRLGQFLRGLAIHLIEDYEPQYSLVITPQKMKRFYDEVKMVNELHPWNEVFTGRVPHQELSHIYRDLKCEQHFVQPIDATKKPSIPCLTPVGFETWMTKMIIAHPDLEFERFAKAALNMPISNADDPKERFPKELSRRLFPIRSNQAIRLDIDSSIYAGALEGFRETPQAQQPAAPPPASSVPRPQPSAPPQQPKYSAPPSSMPATNNDRTDAMSTASSEGAIDDSTPTQSSVNPIERQRKPYHAQPGQGKQFGDGDTRANRSESVPKRSNTTSSTARPYVPKPKEPLDDYGVPPRARGNSLAAPQIPAGARGRHRSQSRSSNPYTRSDTSVKPVPPYVNQGATMQQEDTYEDNDLRRYSTQPTDDRRRQSRYDDLSSQASGASRDPRESREFRDSRDLRDPRDHGPPSARHDEDPRRSRTYMDYPPPPPPNYR